jgi:hypothetical protein
LNAKEQLKEMLRAACVLLIVFVPLAMVCVPVFPSMSKVPLLTTLPSIETLYDLLTDVFAAELATYCKVHCSVKLAPELDFSVTVSLT